LQPVSGKVDSQLGNVGFDRGYIGFDPKDAGRDNVELAGEVGLVRVDARFERVDARSKASTERGDCGEDFVFVGHRFRSVRLGSVGSPEPARPKRHGKPAYFRAFGRFLK
jgi:hypothetical protein